MKNMKINKIDYSFMQKDKNSSYSLDSSRTADSISDLYNSDSIPLKTEIESEQKIKLEQISPSYDNSINVKIEQNRSEESKTKEQNKFFLFKLHISITLGIIYFILFLMSMPKRPIIIGEEKNLNTLIENSNNDNLHILLNNFNLYHDDKIEVEIKKDNNNENINNMDDKIYNKNEKKNNNNSGYLIEYKTDKTYLIRWLIGFLFFTVRCICFIYSDMNFTYKFFDKKKISLIQKVSCLIFPLWIFFYDIKNNNITYTKIKTDIINNKIISYYVMTNKTFSMIDYVEGIIPTLFYFLLSIINNGMEKAIGNYLGNRKKITKLV